MRAASPPPQPLPASSRSAPSGEASATHVQGEASPSPPQEEDEELADWEKPQQSYDEMAVPTKVPTARGVTNLRARLMSRGFLTDVLRQKQ